MATAKQRRKRLFMSVAALACAPLILIAAQSQGGNAALPQRPTSAPTDDARLRYPAGHYPQIALPGGDRAAIRSLLTVPKALRFGGFVWNDDGVPAGPVWILIDPAHQTLSVFRAGHEIGTSVILYGAPGNPTPTGRFHVMAKERAHRSTLYEADMPYMLRLTGDGIAIHGSLVRSGYASRGCIGVPDAFARRLFDQVRTGDMVAILPDRSLG